MSQRLKRFSEVSIADLEADPADTRSPSTPPSHLSAFPAHSHDSHILQVLQQKERYIAKCTQLIIEKNQQNLRLQRTVESLLRDKERLQSHSEQLQAQLGSMQESYIKMLEEQQQARSRVDEDSVDEKFELLEIIRLHEQKIKNLQYQLEIKEQIEVERKSSVLPAHNKPRNNVHRKRFDKERFCENVENLNYFRSTKGLFGVDLNLNRETTLTKGKPGKGYSEMMLRRR